MSITKVINVDVNTGDANAELEKLEGSFKEVDKAAEKTNKSVDDVAGNGGAIAILDQLTGGLATRFRDAYEASKLFNFSLGKMKTALIATGIGALVVALGLIFVYWEDIVELINGANKKLQEQIDLTNEIADNIKFEKEVLDLLIDIEDARGKSTKKLLKDKKTLLRTEQANVATQLILAQADLERVKSLGEQASWWEKIVGFQQGYIVEKTKASEEEQAEIKAAEDRLRNLQTLALNLQKQSALFGKTDGSGGETKNGEPTKDSQEQFEETGIQEVNDLQVQSEQEKLRKIQEINDYYYLQGLEREIADIERKAQADVDELVALGAHKEQIEAIEKASQDKIDELVKKKSDETAKANSDNEIKWADLTAEAKLGIAGAVLTDAAKLVDQNSVAGKGIAIAQTGINTAQGIMQAFATLPTIAAIPAAAIVGALGIKNTLDIAKKKIPSATGRGFVSGGSSSGGGGVAAPSFNLVEGTSENQVAESLNTTQDPVQAYVVSGDVTTSQNLDNNIITESGI